MGTAVTCGYCKDSASRQAVAEILMDKLALAVHQNTHKDTHTEAKYSCTNIEPD